MKIYLLDTNILIALFSKKTFFQLQKYLSRLKKPGVTFATCGIVLSEFYSGIPPETLKKYKSFLDDLYYLQSGKGIYEDAGTKMYKLRTSARKASLGDTLIAQITKFHKTTLITADKDFKNFEEIKKEIILLKI